MGYFMLYNGHFRPSDEYLKTHHLEGYVFGDEEHDDYDLEDDHVVFTTDRVCEKCKKHFTLENAIADFNEYYNFDLNYTLEYCGELCGNCAIDDHEERIHNQPGFHI